METKRFVIFTGLWQGDTAPEVLPVKEQDDCVVCADGGYVICSSAGIIPDAVIGDFDSLSEEFISDIENFGIERISYPHEKEDTDTMLCIKYGIARGFERFLIIGGIGGDFGHTIANVQTLSYLTDIGCAAEINTGRERIFMIDGRAATVYSEAKPAVAEFTGRPGMKFSVMSYSERCTGVFIKNAKYELDNAVLTQSYPIGVSNEFAGEGPVKVSVCYGRLIIITSLI